MPDAAARFSHGRHAGVLVPLFSIPSRRSWGIGELPTLSLAIIVAVMWTRSDEREAKRRDRQADRDGDAELEEYNAMLAKMAERDRRP